MKESGSNRGFLGGGSEFEGDFREIASSSKMSLGSDRDISVMLVPDYTHEHCRNMSLYYAVCAVYMYSGTSYNKISG